MNRRSWIVLAIALCAAIVGGIVISSTPEAEVNVSATAGYQGQAEVVVNPADPLALVVAGADDTGATAWSSVDGGASYVSVSLPLLFDGHTFAEGKEPAVAVDNDGIWYAAYEVHDLDGGLNPIDSSLVVARSFDGLVWEAAAIVEDNRGAGASPAVETPHLAADTAPVGCTSYSDRLFMVWIRKTGGDRAVYRNYSTTDATTWTSSTKINDGVSGAEDVWRPRVAVGPDGRTYVAWLDDLLGAIMIDTATNGGHTYGLDVAAATVTVGCDSGDCGRALTCSGGALHGSTPALAVDNSWTASRGTVYIGFADEIVPADGLDVLVTASTDSGANWSAPVQVSSVATRQQYGPALAVHPIDGSLHAAWYDRRNDSINPDCETETWHAVSTDGGAVWSDETVASSAPSDYTGDIRGEGANLSIAAGSGKVYPAWTDNRAANHEIYLGRIAQAGGTWIQGGNISANTTWFAADGPYIVIGDVTVDVGATLTIEAGTELRMATCDSLRSGVDASRIEFIVEGVLDAAGTFGNEVQFHSGDPAPAKSDWYGIRFQNTADSSDSTLTFTTIEHTRYGMRLTSSSPTLEDLTIELAATNGIQGSARTAFPFSPTRVTVSDAGIPVVLTGINGTWTDVTLQNSSGDAGTITGNSLDIRMVGLRVLNNNLGGLDVHTSGGGLEVILSEFNGNGAGEAGLTINGSGPRTLVANDFNGNSDDGLELSSTTSGWPAVAVYGSNLDGNSGAAIRVVTSSLPGDARHNYWGALNAEMTEYPKNISGIVDIHDNPVLRHVDFRENESVAVANDTDLETYLALPPAMNDNETVIYGGAVARAGVLKVEVSTDGGTIWSDATIEGAAFSMFWAPTPGVYTVMSRVTDTLLNVELVPDQVTVTVSAGPTLAGTLLADETWTGPTPIVLEGDVVVPSGTTLTIDPGTTVHSQYLTDSAFGGLDPSRIEIIVEGVMTSDGAPGNVVVWDSSRVVAGASKGDWYGIRYTDTTTDELSIITSTEIGHGVNGVKLENAAPDILASTIANCSVDGLTGTSGALAKPLWLLNDNTFADNDDDGVDVTGSTEVQVRNATITGNVDFGMRLDASPNVVTVTDSTISGNGDDGLWISSGNSGFILMDSIIQNNGGEGVFVSSGGTDIRLERLTVTGNTDNGIYVSSGTNVAVLKSTITGNRRGLQIGSPRLVAAYNTITGNTGDLVPDYQGSGVYYSSGTGVPAVLEMNDVDNSVDYEVYMTASRALKARRNYWGVTTTTNMNGAGFPADLGEFRDINEDRTRGVVDYDNWAAASVAGSAPGDLAAHITWPGSGTSLDITSVVLTGVAYATDGIDRVEVCVREQGIDPVCGDGAGETPFGVVTDKEAWTFEWFPPGSGTFDLQVRVVDTGDIKSVPSETVTYIVNVLGATVNGPIALSGPIIADQTWSGAIELTGDVIVEAGSTLTLAAGTTVKARALVDDRLDGEDTSRIELIVRGNLVTQGTGGAPVSLSSTRIVPEKRDWRGMRFEATSDAAFNDLDWTTVDAGWHGIEFRDTWSTLDEVSCNNNHEIGLYLPSSATFPASTTIAGGSFLNNGTYGMRVNAIDGTWVLDGVEFGNNGSIGLFVWSCNGDGPITMNGINSHDNGSYGAYLYNCIRPVELLASTIDGNTSTGFYSVSATTVVARANTFTNQGGVAMNLSSPGELIASKNSFSGNRYNALISDGSGQTKVVFNDFGPWTNLTDENVVFSGGSAATFKSVHFNNFREFAPATGDVILRNAVASSINGRANYWDPDTTAEMNSNPFPSNITSIDDVEDTGTWGRVDWRAHRSAAVDLSPLQVCGFINPVDGDTLTGTTFNLQGAAAADAGIQVVEISTDGGSSWNPAIGEELWSFEWTPPMSNPYTLQCRVTDVDAGVQAAPAAINVTVNAAAITTSGVLTTDETWSGVIVLTGDVIVPNGLTLTIEEGTIVKATPQSDDQFGGLDASKIELIIEGTFNLQSSPALPATFTSDRTLPAVPTAGDWYGIRLLDTADSAVTIHDILVEAAVRGIWGYPGSHHDVVDCIVQDMTQDGIYMQFGNLNRDLADPGILISGNTVQRTGSSTNGIYLARSGSNTTWNDAVHQVTGNTTDDTGTRGLYLLPGNAERLEATGNVISNTGYGLRINAGTSATYTNRLEVTGNQVTNGTTYGMFMWTARELLLESNTITGGTHGLYTRSITNGRIARNSFSAGSGDGIILQSSGSSNMTLHRNSVTGYGDDSLVASSLVSFTALYNTFDSAGGDAIEVSTLNAAGVPRIHWNNIQGSIGYDLNHTSAHGADLKHNYWDATNGELIGEGYPSEISEIFDIDDINTRGRIDYRGVENLA
ncbi:MAG: right-handed parallel beta-helix repeat-containing protein, partial [Acidobacteria bacterium]|nr:right-handed parallel beta-helix repeat-containing protein [Candidatus Polarisedimenticola svalbardensis]